MTPPVPDDPVLYLAAVNSWAKDARDRALQLPRGSAGRTDALTEQRALYALKGESAARLAYAGLLHLSKFDWRCPQPAALMIGYSPALGPHAFHLPVPPHAWALNIPRTDQRSRQGSGQRLRRAMTALPPRDEVLAALHALPPLPRRVALDWGLASPRPGWSALETERATAPGGVPRRRARSDR